MGGEKGLHAYAMSAATGSPPAWAGKRVSTLHWQPTTEDHPRVGGEKTPPSWQTMRSVGSPPRRRGKDAVIALGRHTHRITPTWAGKSCGWASCGGLSWDHPRMGGEKYKVYVYNTVDKGSPPHGRGKDDTAVQLGARAGITPAWAGKSLATLAERGN